MTLPRLTVLLGLPLLLTLLVPISGHGDMYLSTYNSSLILTDHPNFYHAVADEPSGVLPTGLSGGPYGPLFYYPTALWLAALDSAHLIDVQSWHHLTFDATLRELPSTFLLKLPYLAVYILVALALARTLGNGRGETAALLWLVNPAVILYALLMGQNDGWAFLASVIALLFAVRALEDRGLQIAGRRVPARLLAMAALAVGAAIKLSPILLVIPFALLLGRNLRERALLGAVGFGVFGLLVLPFLWTPYFWDHGLFGTQAGKATREGIAAFAALYAAFIVFLPLLLRRWERDPSAAVFLFVAVHALIFLLPEWNPQRSILLIGALSLAVPMRRVFLLPYFVVTAYAMLLTLGHGNDLGTGLFEPLSGRVFNIPPLDEFIPREPLQMVFLWLGGIAWGAALILFWRTQPASSYSPPPAIVPLLPASLIIYLVAAFSLLPRGVDISPYPAAETRVAPAGQTFAFSFFAGRDDLRAITFNVLSGETAAEISVTDGGTLLPPSDFVLRPGANRIELGHVEKSSGALFRVSITPTQPTALEMAEVPPALSLASADLDGVPVPGTAAFSVHYQSTWGGLLGDALRRLQDEWPTVGASLVLCIAASGALGLRRQAWSRIRRKQDQA